ncbi:PREDICTED: ankyrin repeat domain-containing protein 16-like [Dinoponera quadriceps]|uniref:Ankyrin repeat domain-containing protein 16-like n=1 Tax=Dinoponera quadriceps TaxID=609295 RepID=A0A6P3XP06_DINQU|nr:PREDICTED: ankyrin repeat domain-containing protein 16-like [Dinoponera quadriceps]
MFHNVATADVASVSRNFLRACQNGDAYRVETLVATHGIRDWCDFRHTDSGDTALHVAARAGNMNVVKYLCEHFDMSTFKIDVTNKDMKRPSHEAAQFAREDVLKYLLEKGASVDALKRGDWTPLMLACTKSGYVAFQCIVTLLMAKANARLRNKDGWTPLFIACRAGDENVVDLLLEHMPECIDDRSNNGRSAMHIAAFHDHERVINSLVALRPSLLNAQDSSGSTPLHEAMKSGNLNAARRIVNLGADVNLVDNVGQTILHVATLTGNVEAVEYILEYNLIDVNRKASFGITPLMAARRSNHSDVIDILMKNGAM